MKILVLENQDFNPKADRHFHDWLKAEGTELIVYDRLLYRDDIDPVVILTTMRQADIIACTTTFTATYDHTFVSMANILAKVSEPKKIVIDAVDPQAELERIFRYESDDPKRALLAHSISHHSIFKLEYDGTLIPISLQQIYDDLAPLLTRREFERQYKLAARTRPIAKVKVLKVQACGPEWSLLKEGDVVDSLDMSEVDDKPNRGVWVWGKTEPVKLLNERPYNEYEVTGPITPDVKVMEIFRSIKMTETFTPTKTQVYAVKGLLLSDDDELHFSFQKANAICELLDIEKRGNRTVFCSIIDRN